MELQYTNSSGRSIESAAAAAAAVAVGLSAVKMSPDHLTCDFASPSRILVKLRCHDTVASPAAAASSTPTQTNVQRETTTTTTTTIIIIIIIYY